MCLIPHKAGPLRPPCFSQPKIPAATFPFCPVPTLLSPHPILFDSLLWLPRPDFLSRLSELGPLLGSGIPSAHSHSAEWLPDTTAALVLGLTGGHEGTTKQVSEGSEGSVWSPCVGSSGVKPKMPSLRKDTPPPQGHWQDNNTCLLTWGYIHPLSSWQTLVLDTTLCLLSTVGTRGSRPRDLVGYRSGTHVNCAITESIWITQDIHVFSGGSLSL